MAALDLGTLVGIFEMLPFIFTVAQIFVYIFAVFFFGSIARQGYKGFLEWYKKLGLRIVLGLICVVTGVAIAPFMGIQNSLLKMLQIDTFVGMFVSSVVVAVSLRLMTWEIPYSIVIKKQVKVLQDKLAKRKDKNDHVPKNITRRPITIAGLVVFIAFIAFSLLFFRGFTSMQQNIFSSLGISDADLAKLGDAVKQYQNSPFADMSAGCIAAIQEMGGKTELLNNPPVYNNPSLQAQIEAGSGEPVAEMYRIDSNGLTMIKSVGAKGKQCFATPTEFCICA